MTFLLTLANDGPSDATGVEVTDLPDEGLTLVSATPSQGTFAPASHVWDVGPLAAGETATLILVFEAPVGTDVTLLNRAEVTAADQPDPDSTPGNAVANEDDFSGDIGDRKNPDPADFRTDLKLLKEVDNPTPSQGDQVTYTLTLTNESARSTAGVQVTDLLPEGVMFVEASPSDADDSYDPSTGIWDVGKLKNGESTTLTITVTVDGAGEIVNTAEVTANNLPDLDSTPGNGLIAEDDMSSASINVQAAQSKAGGDVPLFVELRPNYPNPFNPETVIPFALPEASHVTLTVYDLLGRAVQVLADGELAAGTHEVTFRASSLPTGVYLVRLETPDTVQTRRITLMK